MFWWKSIDERVAGFEGEGLKAVGLWRKSKVNVLVAVEEVGRSLRRSSARRFRGRGKDFRSAGKRSFEIGEKFTSGRLISSLTSLIVKAV